MVKVRGERTLMKDMPVSQRPFQKFPKAGIDPLILPKGIKAKTGVLRSCFTADSSTTCKVGGSLLRSRILCQELPWSVINFPSRPGQTTG